LPNVPRISKGYFSGCPTGKPVAGLVDIVADRACALFALVWKYAYQVALT
jgi:hypothetical protein